MFRRCHSCGRTYASQEEVLDLYAAYAYAINRQAVIDPNEPVEFCPSCGEDFTDLDSAPPWRRQERSSATADE